jgi:hypothetical protein
MKKVPALLNLAQRVAKCRLFPCLLVSSVLVLMPGCGEKRVPVYKVEGTVSYAGEAPVGAQVVFHPDGHTLPEGDVAIGSVKDGGKFDVNIYGTGGIPAGNYIATFQWRKLVESEGGFGAGPNVIPEKYGSPSTSPVKVTIKEDVNVLDPIVIEK